MSINDKNDKERKNGLKVSHIKLSATVKILLFSLFYLFDNRYVSLFVQKRNQSLQTFQLVCLVV